MITTPLLNDAGGNKRLSYITFTLSCVALAMLCWIAFAGTKLFPDSGEFEVGSPTQAVMVAADWTGKPYPSPTDPHGKVIANYPAATFGGQIQGGTEEYQTWKTTGSGLTVYHGSNVRFDATRASGNHQGIWFSPDFAAALGAGVNTMRQDGGTGRTVVMEYILKNSKNCKPFLLLGMGAANNAKILHENGFKSSNEEDPPKVTMALGSGINNQIAVHLRKFCETSNYCGWRSPFDQNEVFICNKCMKHCLEATVNIYKIAWGDLPEQMAVEYWFPNQEVKTTVNNYVGKDGNEDSNKGKEAVQSGETLAFYAYSYKKTQSSSESQENDEPNKVPSKPKGPKVDKEKCTKTLPPEIMFDNDQIDGKMVSSSGCSSESKWKLIPLSVGGLTGNDNIILEDEEEELTPKAKSKK